MVSIGRMNDILTFGSVEKTPDGIGGFVPTFSELGKAYARVERRSEVRNLDGADRNVYVIEFYSRYVDNVDASCNLKLNSDESLWNIETVIDRRGRRESLYGLAWKEI